VIRKLTMRCKAQVSNHDWGRTHQCPRDAKKDGYCMQHHPDSVAKRRAKSDARFEEKRARAHAPYERLNEMSLALQRIKCAKSLKEAKSVATKALMFKEEVK